MSNLSSLYIKKEVLEMLLKGVNHKQAKGIEITISTGDEENIYGQNVSAYVSQSKEEREAKKDRYYIGNGKTFWTDGKITAFTGSKQSEPSKSKSEKSNEPEDDLPF